MKYIKGYGKISKSGLQRSAYSALAQIGWDEFTAWFKKIRKPEITEAFGIMGLAMTRWDEQDVYNLIDTIENQTHIILANDRRRTAKQILATQYYINHREIWSTIESLNIDDVATLMKHYGQHGMNLRSLQSLDGKLRQFYQLAEEV